MKLEWTQEMMEDLKNTRGFGEDLEEKLVELLKENDIKEHSESLDRSRST